MTSWGTAGDMHPFLAVAACLQRRGHRITFLAPPVHEALVTRAGFGFRPLGTDAQYQAALDDPEMWDERKALGVVWRSIRPSLVATRDLVATLPPDEPCWVLTHPIALPLAALARTVRHDLHIVGGYLAPGNLRSCRDPMTVGPRRLPGWVPRRWRRWIWDRVDASVIDPVFLPTLNEQRAAMGLGAVPRFIPHLQGTADVSLTLFPPWFGRPQPDWPTGVISGVFPLHEAEPGEGLSQTLSDFLAAGDAPIVFTPGTGHRHASPFFASALAAVARIGRRAIFLTPHRHQLPPQLPSHVLWQAHAPLRALLPRVAALVHHGGIGTSAEALRAGTPQVVVAYAFDQFDNGVRVRELGVGEMLPASRATPRRLAQAITGVLSSRPRRDSCAAASRRFASDISLDALCDELESTLAHLPQRRQNNLEQTDDLVSRP
nr:nucleotide disphospho-sugar-binding domain-containing protein [Caldimonas brevitalea]